MSGAVLAKNKKVMYVDVSLTKKFYFKIFGNATESIITYRGICYTKDDFYATEHWNEYDVVILCSDDGSSLQSVTIPFDHVYLICGISRGSLSLLENIINNTVLADITYSLVLRASEQQVNYFNACRALDVITSKYLPESIYYVPLNEKDIENELLLDYGSVDMRQVSANMQKLLWDLKAGFLKL